MTALATIASTVTRPPWRGFLKAGLILAWLFLFLVFATGTLSDRPVLGVSGVLLLLFVPWFLWDREKVRVAHLIWVALLGAASGFAALVGVYWLNALDDLDPPGLQCAHRLPQDDSSLSGLGVERRTGGFFPRKFCDYTLDGKPRHVEYVHWFDDLTYGFWGGILVLVPTYFAVRSWRVLRQRRAARVRGA